MSFKKLADSTVQIEVDNDSQGTGFQFMRDDIVVTNAHVVKPTLTNGRTAKAVTEDGDEVKLDLIDFSLQNQHDFAIFRTKTDLPDSRTVLSPQSDSPERGDSILFAGFPHGIDDLLVHEASVSGPFKDKGFFIDGSVNGGNSGGPIVSADTNELVGIVTKRRFLGKLDLNQASRQLSQINQHFKRMGGKAGVKISGIDFGDFATKVSNSVSIVDQVIQMNANTGIGIGYGIESMLESYEQSVQR